MAHGVKRDRFYCCCSDFALNLLLLTFVTPVMTRELALLRRAISILFSATLIVSFIPARGFAEPADMTGSNLDSATFGSSQLTGAILLTLP